MDLVVHVLPSEPALQKYARAAHEGLVESFFLSARIARFDQGNDRFPVGLRSRSISLHTEIGGPPGGIRACSSRVQLG